MSSPIKWTAKQRQLLTLIKDPDNIHVLAYGGSRSGKTFLYVAAIVYRALKYPGSRHLIARSTFSHVRISIWLDTLDKVLRLIVPQDKYKKNESDRFVRFTNKSEIWVDGLDDKERVDKILGREYATIFFNEITQMSYNTVVTVMTRLSQNVEGCKNEAYYDCNPGGFTHWAYKVFIKHETPEGKPIGKGYASLLLNPEDNKENLPKGYIEDILDRLPEYKRKRFRLGQWSDAEGVIFTNWDIVDEVPEEILNHSRRMYGLDFGFSVDPAALVQLWMNGDEIWVDELIYDTGLNNQMLADIMDSVIEETGITIVADSAEPKSINELQIRGYNVEGAIKGPDSVRSGIDWLLSKKLHLTKRSVNVQNELENYKWKVDRTGRTNPEPIDDFNHAIDAIRYGCSEWVGLYVIDTVMGGETWTADMLGL